MGRWAVSQKPELIWDFISGCIRSLWAPACLLFAASPAPLRKKGPAAVEICERLERVLKIICHFGLQRKAQMNSFTNWCCREFCTKRDANTILYVTQTICLFNDPVWVDVAVNSARNVMQTQSCTWPKPYIREEPTKVFSVCTSLQST